MNTAIKKIPALVLLFFTGFAGLMDAKAQNPIVQTRYTADPAPMVYKDTLFLYTSHDEDNSTWFVMKDWHVYSTTDMVNWVDRGSPLSLGTFKWAEKDAWASQCIERNGKFYWYICANDKDSHGMAIGVAVSDSPAGPFKDALGKPLVSGGWGFIDPTVFIDDDGQAYLYWGNPHLYYVKLNSDMVSYEEGTGVVKVPLTEEGFKLRIHNAHNTFEWAESIDGLASHVVKSKAGDKYYWYVSATEKNSNRKVIGVAVGDRAIGPFSDVLGKPFITEYCDGANINPTVIWDEAKQAWLTWGASDLWYTKLNSDMISSAAGFGPEKIPDGRKEWFRNQINGTVNSTEKRFTTYEEGPWVYKRNQRYYLFYPAGGVPEHLAYSTSESLSNPDWKYGDTVMAIIKKGGAFTNHPGVVDYKGKTYLFYHNGALPGGGGFNRSVCVDELLFNDDGSVREVTPTAGIEDAVGTLNPFNRVEAETIAWSSGLKTARDSENGGIYVTDVHNGDYIKIRGVDFKKGASSFSAGAAAEAGGIIEVRLDSLSGPLAGALQVKSTGGTNKWKSFSAKMKNIEGLHDIFLVFRGKDGELFNFDWWRFAPVK
ncbi:family 43 glycosylhydrolase [Pararcticibacter amylolyticus]|uniref:Glycoside hydrolase n=1 Tax=Pararcticibacter amylolyticus TaxID=2173175 RepID=A0A2U2PIU6_9SPHI|nr:family 43 glycosylhydrolase [Pararcticibacter amylolyticus]PWG81300.1 glycoside hydrolase [Pararcticibacter amylolyticus]